MKEEKEKEFDFLINFRRSLLCYFYSFIEFLSTKIDIIYNYLMQKRRIYHIEEIKMANITSKDKVLHLGCGFLPTASIIIAQETKSETVGIDNNSRVIKHARDIIRKNNLDNLIKIVYGDGVDFSVKDFDIIFIAVNVWPIDSILSHLLSDVNKGTKIVCRSFKNDMVNYLKEKEPKMDFYIKSIFRKNKFQSVLIIKK